MISAIPIALCMQLITAAAPLDLGQYVCIERLSPRVVLAYWLGVDRRCNLTAIQSRKGLVIIDTEASPRIMASIKEKIETVFGRSDWAFVINTHAHDNHCSGNCLFKGAVIVGHDNLPADMLWLTRRQVEAAWKQKELGQAASAIQHFKAVLPQCAADRSKAAMVRGEIAFWELFSQDLQDGYDIVPPSLRFADRLSLDLGDLTLELVFFGRGHSNSDILTYVPQERLLVTGGVAYARGQLPEISEDSELVDMHRFISVLDHFLADGVPIDHVISSHSLPQVRDDLLPVRDYYQRMLVEVRAAQKEGLTLEQAVRRLTVAAKFRGFRDPPPGSWGYGMQERNVGNLWRILKR